ncbi:MAG TPA: mycothiol system anti-sigma-R factor [Mycobacteriales bacterium]
MSCGNAHDADCSDVLEAVFLYLDGECDETQQVVIRQHLDECSPCLRKFGIEQDVKALVARKCGGDVAPLYLRERLRARLAEVGTEGGQVEIETTQIETTRIEYRRD